MHVLICMVWTKRGNLPTGSVLWPLETIHRTNQSRVLFVNKQLTFNDPSRFVNKPKPEPLINLSGPWDQLSRTIEWNYQMTFHLFGQVPYPYPLHVSQPLGTATLVVSAVETLARLSCLKKFMRLDEVNKLLVYTAKNQRDTLFIIKCWQKHDQKSLPSFCVVFVNNTRLSLPMANYLETGFPV